MSSIKKALNDIRYSFRTVIVSGLLLFSLPVFSESESSWFPEEYLFPVLIADPHQLNFQIALQSYSESTVPDSDSSRWDLKASAPLVIYQNRTAAGKKWQLVLLGGLRGQFDNGNNQDSIAWEGYYGLQLGMQQNANVIWRVGGRHYSSHIGDEYIERTGRTRINYTRNEYNVGLAWKMADRYVSFLELGYGFNLANDELQKPWRVQTGVQYKSSLEYLDNSAGWYGAINVSAYEENDWDTNVTIQTGFYFPGKRRQWRVGLEYYDGRNVYGEFFQFTEKYVSLGLWIDI